MTTGPPGPPPGMPTNATVGSAIVATASPWLHCVASFSHVIDEEAGTNPATKSALGARTTVETSRAPLSGVPSWGAETAKASWIEVSAETCGVFVTIRTVATSPLAMSPSAHVTTATLAVQDGSDPPATNDSPGASVSVSETSVASPGPRLVTVAVDPRSYPPVTGSGTFATEVSSRSATSLGRGSTVLLTVSPLLVSSGSGVDAVTVASTSKNVSTSTSFARTTKVTGTSAGPGLMVPRSHVTVVSAMEQVPGFADISDGVNPGGRWPTRVTPSAGSGPSL